MLTPFWKLPPGLRRKNRRRAGLILAVLIIAVIGAAAAAAQGSAPTFIRWVMASGGGSSSAEGVVINDTLGQPFAGPALSADNSVSLMSGYWTAGGGGAGRVYLPCIMW